MQCASLQYEMNSRGQLNIGEMNVINGNAIMDPRFPMQNWSKFAL